MVVCLELRKRVERHGSEYRLVAPCKTSATGLHAVRVIARLRGIAVGLVLPSQKAVFWGHHWEPAGGVWRPRGCRAYFY